MCSDSLLQQVLERLENESGGELVVATLCLLECSRHGLLESELLLLLGNEKDLLPPADGWMESDQAIVRDVLVCSLGHLVHCSHANV